MKIKLCGFTDVDSVEVAVSCGCDFLGFVFSANSPRNISFAKAKELSAIVPNSISKVAVVADESMKVLEKIIAALSPQYFQFHGSETPEFIDEVRKKFPHVKIIKALKISSKIDLDQVFQFEKYCDLFLFDANLPGNGVKFDWKILKNFHSKKNWFLSGGINVNNIEEAIRITNAKMIDLSSGIEEIRGVKSPRLIIEFMKKVKKLC